MRQIWIVLSILMLAIAQSACAPEVGTKKWCESMDDKSGGDWSGNEAKAYAKHCVFENYIDEKD